MFMCWIWFSSTLFFSIYIWSAPNFFFLLLSILSIFNFYIGFGTIVGATCNCFRLSYPKSWPIKWKIFNNRKFGEKQLMWPARFIFYTLNKFWPTFFLLWYLISNFSLASAKLFSALAIFFCLSNFFHSERIFF